MDRKLSRRKNHRRTRGAAMVEALLSYFVLFLVLFGMLHVFYFFCGQFFADYAALRGARSRAVGFNNYLVERETRINAIGGSGILLTPRLHSAGTGNSKYDATQFTMEKTLIQRYMVGATWMEYEYWFGCCGNPRLDITIKDSDRSVQTNTCFTDYAFPLYASDVQSDGEGNMIRRTDGSEKKVHFFFHGVDLRGSASLGNHSHIYLKD